MTRYDEYNCAVLFSLGLLGKKWVPLILTELMNAFELHFSELKREIYEKYNEKISARVLSDTLSLLQEEEIIDRKVVSKKPKRVIYYLSTKGEDLIPIFAALKAWNIKWYDPNHKRCQSDTCLHDKIPTINFDKLKKLMTNTSPT